MLAIAVRMVNSVYMVSYYQDRRLRLRRATYLCFISADIPEIIIIALNNTVFFNKLGSE